MVFVFALPWLLCHSALLDIPPKDRNINVCGMLQFYDLIPKDRNRKECETLLLNFNCVGGTLGGIEVKYVCPTGLYFTGGH